MKAYTVSIGTTATRIVPTAAEVSASPTGATWAGGTDQTASFHLKNPSANTIYLGGSDVNTTSGFPLLSGESIEIDLQSDALFGVVAAATETVSILRTS
jgi:hypothetical protein